MKVSKPRRCSRRTRRASTLWAMLAWGPTPRSISSPFSTNLPAGHCTSSPQPACKSHWRREQVTKTAVLSAQTVTFLSRHVGDHQGTGILSCRLLLPSVDRNINGLMCHAMFLSSQRQGWTATSMANLNATIGATTNICTENTHMQQRYMCKEHTYATKVHVQ